MKKLLPIIFALGCSPQYYLEKDLKDLTNMIHVHYLCVEDSDKDSPASWDSKKDCLEINMNLMTQVSQKYGLSTAKGIWLYHLGMYKKQDPDRFSGCQMAKFKIRTDKYLEFLKNQDNSYNFKRKMNFYYGYDSCK